MKRVHVIVYFLCLTFLMKAQVPDLVLTSSEPLRAQSAQAFLLEFDDSEVADWLETRPEHMDSYAVAFSLPFSGEEPVESATIELTIPDAGSWQMLFERETLPAGADIICKSLTTGMQLWRVRATAMQRERQMTPPVNEQGVILNIKYSQSAQLQDDLKGLLYLKPVELVEGHRSTGFGSALACEKNTSCPQGNGWADQARSVLRIRVVFEEGSGWCSGTLLNNTAEDATPYLLGAEHCQGNNTPIYDMWRFDFLYQSETCDNPPEEPAFHSITGCEFRAKDRDSDILLLEISQPLPSYVEAYFSGWNREDDYEPQGATLIHHPQADIKKISLEDDSPTLFPFDLDWSEGYTTPEYSHYKMKFDTGGFEPGSSGAGVFDENKRLIGELHGGNAGCESENNAYIGAISYAWDTGLPSERLDVWLDPLGTGQLTLDGLENPATNDSYALTCVIADPKGNPMPNVELTISGDISEVYYTDSNGEVQLPVVARSATIDIEPYKNTDPDNGVSASDLLLIQKHILDLVPFQENYKILAADATANQNVSASDLFLLQKLILGLVQTLPSSPSWVFDPPSVQLENVGIDTMTVQFMGIKIGDVNGTADPAK